MHSQPPKSPLSGGLGKLRGILETLRRSELLVNVYLFLEFTIITLILGKILV